MRPISLSRLLPVLLAAALLGALAPEVVEAASLRPAGALHAAGVSTASIRLAWKDRSKGESAYRLQSRVDGSARWASKTLRRDSERAHLGGLGKGLVYEVRVEACRGGRCSARGRSIEVATLLAPFNGPHPDAECATFPTADEFNRDVSAAPLDPRSAAIVARIDSDGPGLLHPDFGSNPSYGIPFVVVPHGQPLFHVKFTAYGDESDRVPYPVPPGAPVEGGADASGDRHVIVVRRPPEPGGACRLYELYRSFQTGARTIADAGASFDLGLPLAGQRPDGWTSADAAGLPIYPGLISYEEVSSGVIDHAIRVTFDETRKGYVSPATHYASSSCDPNLPPMGMRFRLKAGYDTSGLGGDARVIATALKRYGMINADNGSDWFISGSTDRRWDDENLNGLKEIPGSAFEVVQSGNETSPC
ncbi:MAG: fibronectin type III domain-containing protein [Solirubrobacterales bacterium]